ncbi:MAG TPA: c-type cytochrome, partial [Candidatus Binatia bacterium]|nr:c-type cytochrome [Candidatus Binatia bacterium]
MNELGHQAYRVATDQSASLPARVAAVRVVGRSNAKAVGRVLIELLKPEQSTDLQAAAVKALAELNDAALSASAVAGWEQYSRATRQRLVAAAPRTGALADALLTASEQGKIQLIEVDPSTRQALQRNSNPELKRRAENLFRGAISADREQVVQNFKPAVQMNGNRKHGAEIFAKTCLRCHAMQGEGARVGPDLSVIATPPRETMLMNILDPSRQVLPDFLSYTVATVDGETSTGLITAESATSVTIRRPDVTDVTIQRDQIKELKADGKSLMPDGLEAGLTVQDMAD